MGNMITGSSRDPEPRLLSRGRRETDAPGQIGERNVLLGKPLLDTLERIGCGGLVLDERGHVVLVNGTAQRILEDDLGRAGGMDEPEWLRAAIAKLLRQASGRLRLNRDKWVRIPRGKSRDLVLHAMPVGDNRDGSTHTVLIIVDLRFNPEPASEVLEKMFGLTPAETRTALQITRGDTPADIARKCDVSIATVRSQLASVFAKTQATRQSKLVALLARVSILPGGA